MSAVTTLAKGGKLAVTRLRPPGVAECEGCADLHPDSTRERCRIHAVQTGHVVRFVIEDTTVYRPSRPKDAP